MASTYKVSILLGDGTVHTEDVAADRYEKTVDGDLNFYRDPDNFKVATFRSFSWIVYTDPKEPTGTPSLPDKTATTDTTVK